MKLVVDREQRNYNYLALIALYNDYIECYGVNGNINALQFKQFKDRLLQSTIGFDSVDLLLRALVLTDDFDAPSLDLFCSNGDGYDLYKQGKFMPEASREEALMIYSMLENGDFDLYLNDTQKQRLHANLKLYFDNLGEKPVNLLNAIESKGASLCADRLGDIKPIFSLLHTAVTQKLFVKINYFFNDVVTELVLQPVSFVYSQLDLRLRVKAYQSDGECRTYYISNIKSISLLNSNPFTPYEVKDTPMKTLVFSFENNKSRAERVAARFSDYKKTVKYQQKKNRITYHIYYPDYPGEANRILYRLRSLGKGIDIQTDEKEAVKADALKALQNYR